LDSSVQVWSFVHSKAKNVPAEHQGEWGYGDVWTWVAIDADTKLVPAYLIGSRDAMDGYRFMTDLAGRLRNRILLTTDGHRPYLIAVEGAFGSDVDYAVLQTLYGVAPDAERRYSPAECVGAERRVIMGDPDPTWSPRATWSDRTSRCGWDAAHDPADQCLLEEGREPTAVVLPGDGESPLTTSN
jgi:IS1 family transposase